MKEIKKYFLIVSLRVLVQHKLRTQTPPHNSDLVWIRFQRSSSQVRPSIGTQFALRSAPPAHQHTLLQLKKLYLFKIKLFILFFSTYRVDFCTRGDPRYRLNLAFRCTLCERSLLALACSFDSPGWFPIRKDSVSQWFVFSVCCILAEFEYFMTCLTPKTTCCFHCQYIKPLTWCHGHTLYLT